MRKMLALLLLLWAPVLGQQTFPPEGGSSGLNRVLILAEYVGCHSSGCQAAPWYAVTSGTGAAIGVPNGSLLGTTDFGLISVATGTTTTGYAQTSGSRNMFPLGATLIEFNTKMYLSALSDGTDTYTVYFGFNDTITGTLGEDAVGIRYTHTENAGNWTGYTRNNSVESTCDIGSAATAGAWWTFEIDVTASAATFSDGTNSCQITTNIPTGTSRASGIVAMGMTKSAGTTSRTAYVDYTLIRTGALYDRASN